MPIEPGAPTRLQHPPDRRRPPAHAIATEAARKDPKCPACPLAHTVLHPYGWAKQGRATDTKVSVAAVPERGQVPRILVPLGLGAQQGLAGVGGQAGGQPPHAGPLVRPGEAAREVTDAALREVADMRGRLASITQTAAQPPPPAAPPPPPPAGKGTTPLPVVPGVPQKVIAALYPLLASGRTSAAAAGLALGVSKTVALRCPGVSGQGSNRIFAGKDGGSNGGEQES